MDSCIPVTQRHHGTGQGPVGTWTWWRFPARLGVASWCCAHAGSAAQGRATLERDRRCFKCGSSSAGTACRAAGRDGRCQWDMVVAVTTLQRAEGWVRLLGPCWRAGQCSQQQGTRTALSQPKKFAFLGSVDMLGCQTRARAAPPVGHPAPRDGTAPPLPPPPPHTHSHMHGHSPGSFTPKLYSCGTFTARIGITRQ